MINMLRTIVGLVAVVEPVSQVLAKDWPKERRGISEAFTANISYL